MTIPERPERITQQISRHIRADIEAGRLRHLQALPSTRDLAERWGVSVNTISAAIKELTADGLIISEDRKGRYINAPNQTAYSRTEDTRVLVIGGYAGCGKTELGRIISRMTNWPILDKDSVTRPMTEAALELAGQPITDRESQLYLTKIRPAEYETLTLTMLENIECGNNTVITAPFIREFKDQAWVSRLEAQCTDLHSKITFIWVRCTADSMHTYLRHRGAARDTWKLNHWDKYLETIDLDYRPIFRHRLIDNSIGSTPLQEQASDLLRSIAVTQ